MSKALKELSRTLRIPFSRFLAFRRLRAYHARPRSLEETVEWAMNFGRYGYLTIHTLQKRSEILALATAVAALQPKIILEIGTARGGTLLVWSSLAAEKVITCDLVHRPAQVPLLEALPPPGSGCRVELLTGNSHEPAFKQRVARALDGRQADFLFIDGDHTEGGVAADYNDYKEFVRPGGIIAFHDIIENQPFPDNQVYGFWKTVKQGKKTEEFVNDPAQCGFGIGIIRV
ncbi:MAG: class I SAM-dependent methyltransferase [Chromatiales bacterium]|nr:class I SAM-dependent methyltransferase [Chromatiales bacterium]